MKKKIIVLMLVGIVILNFVAASDWHYVTQYKINGNNIEFYNEFGYVDTLICSGQIIRSSNINNNNNIYGKNIYSYGYSDKPIYLNSLKNYLNSLKKPTGIRVIRTEGPIQSSGGIMTSYACIQRCGIYYDKFYYLDNAVKEYSTCTNRC